MIFRKNKKKGKNTHYITVVFADEGEMYEEFTTFKEMEAWLDKVKIQIKNRELISNGEKEIVNLGMVTSIYYGEI